MTGGLKDRTSDHATLEDARDALTARGRAGNTALCEPIRSSIRDTAVYERYIA